MAATKRGVQISGLVPDGVREVTVNLENGQALKATVADNVYSVNAGDGGTTTISFDGPSGAVTVPFSTPAVGAFAEERNGKPVRVR